MKNKLRIIYIAGYGRSGSTVLDIALSAVCNEALSLGEIGSLSRRVFQPRLGCSCGEDYHNCRVWTEAVGLIEKSRNKILTYRFLEGPLGFLLLYAIRDYGGFWRQVILERRKHSSRNVSLFVDSSKTAYNQALRPIHLARSGAFEVYVVHLKRSLNEVLSSRARGTNAKLSGRLQSPEVKEVLFGRFWWLRTVFGWFFANLFAEISKRSHFVVGYSDVKFDEVRNNAEGTAIRILNKASQSFSFSFAATETTDGFAITEHIAEGNRFAADLTVKIRCDDSL